jgi:hypothetical protein
VSYRSRQGSIGAKSFSLLTGIPGLSFGKAGEKNVSVKHRGREALASIENAASPENL